MKLDLAWRATNGGGLLREGLGEYSVFCSSFARQHIE